MTNTVTGIKALIGKKFHSEEIQSEIPKVAYKVNNPLQCADAPQPRQPAANRLSYPLLAVAQPAVPVPAPTTVAVSH